MTRTIVTAAVATLLAGTAVLGSFQNAEARGFNHGAAGIHRAAGHAGHASHAALRNVHASKMAKFTNRSNSNHLASRYGLAGGKQAFGKAKQAFGNGQKTAGPGKGAGKLKSGPGLASYNNKGRYFDNMPSTSQSNTPTTTSTGPSTTSTGPSTKSTGPIHITTPGGAAIGLAILDSLRDPPPVVVAPPISEGRRDLIRRVYNTRFRDDWGMVTPEEVEMIKRETGKTDDTEAWREFMKNNSGPPQH